jgi:hypothetical protein
LLPLRQLESETNSRNAQAGHIGGSEDLLDLGHIGL